VNNIKI